MRSELKALLKPCNRWTSAHKRLPLTLEHDLTQQFNTPSRASEHGAVDRGGVPEPALPVLTSLLRFRYEPTASDSRNLPQRS